MLFFQTLLFGGYLAAHLSQRYLRPKLQAVVHLGLIVAALLLLRRDPFGELETDRQQSSRGANFAIARGQCGRAVLCIVVYRAFGSGVVCAGVSREDTLSIVRAFECGVASGCELSVSGGADLGFAASGQRLVVGDLWRTRRCVRTRQLAFGCCCGARGKVKAKPRVIVLLRKTNWQQVHRFVGGTSRCGCDLPALASVTLWPRRIMSAPTWLRCRFCGWRRCRCIC